MNQYWLYRHKNQLDFSLYAVGYKPDEHYYSKLDSLLARLREASKRFLDEHGTQF